MKSITFNELPEAVSVLLEKVDNLAKMMQSGNEQQAETKPEIIDRSELCKRLAITQATAITWEKKGTIPALRIGDCIRYNWPEVLKALEYKKGRKND